MSGQHPPFSCAHACYTAAVHHPRTGLLLTGNVVSGCLYGTYLDPSQPEGWAMFRTHLPPRVVQEMQKAAQGMAQAIAYLVAHTDPGTRKRVVHGAFLTDTSHRLLWSATTGPTWKSADAVAQVIAYILPPVSAHDRLARAARLAAAPDAA